MKNNNINLITMKIKRYLVFAWPDNTSAPLAGWLSFISSYDTYQEAEKGYFDSKYPNGHIIDTKNSMIVWESEPIEPYIHKTCGNSSIRFSCTQTPEQLTKNIVEINGTEFSEAFVNEYPITVKNILNSMMTNKTQRSILTCIIYALANPDLTHAFITHRDKKEISKRFIDTISEFGLMEFVKRNDENEMQFTNGSKILYKTNR